MANLRFFTIIILGSFLTVSSAVSFAQGTAHRELQENIKAAIHRAYASSVFVTTYDTLRKVRNGARSSGVVVSEDGLILTAAHACTPGRTYLVVFPGGKECVAVGLGRMAGPDAAMMKITGGGKWPWSPAGWSSSLAINEPCISISYPGSFEPKEPVVRFGYIADTSGTRRRKSIRTTCLMEPGDSGGPVFDLYGRVVGIHSSVTLPLENNFEIPIDVYRRFWKSLQIPEDYKEFPEADTLEADPLKDKRFTAAMFPQTEQYFSQLESSMKPYCVQITSEGKTGKDSVTGTIVLPEGLISRKQMKKKNFVVSKSSLVGNNPQLLSASGIWVPAVVVERDNKNDLVLLEVKQSFGKGIPFSSFAVSPIDTNSLGTLVVSPQPLSQSGETGVIGASQFSLPRRVSSGQLGVYVEMKDGKLFIGRVMNNTAASAAGLTSGDEIVSVNGNSYGKPEEFSKALQQYDPGDKISFAGMRKDSAFSMEVVLRKRVDGNHIADQFTDGKSLRRDGLASVFTHDSKLKPQECGGPLFDTEGRFMGINIARYSRTSSLAVPAAAVMTFIQEALRPRS